LQNDKLRNTGCEKEWFPSADPKVLLPCLSDPAEEIPTPTRISTSRQEDNSVKHQKLSTMCMIAAVLFFSLWASATDTYTAIRVFNPSTGGGIPYGGLHADSAGNLYGTNSTGGTAGWGTIFELSPNAQGGWDYSVLYNCTSVDCAVPVGSLVMDQSGNVYGSTLFGNVFELTRDASGNWSASLIHAFSGGNEGTSPSPVILDSAGNLYGVNATGGDHSLGYVFELSPSDGGWSLIHLHDFSGSDGAQTLNTAGEQVAGLIMDSTGNLYGTTGAGGSSTKCSGGCGVVFELKNDGGTWTETVLHNFVGSDGSNPNAALLIDAAGKLYGTATAGGADGFGVAFETYPASGGGWRTRVLHSFTGTDLDGEYPNSALIMDSAGNLYGATESGGGDHLSCQVMNDAGCGTVFELSLSGTQWKESILKAFSGRKDGAFPQGVVMDSKGNLYGAAQAGGRLFMGLIFKIAPGTESAK
jgi:uncharacterized repeat protein (TIGR03803 family)